MDTLRNPSGAPARCHNDWVVADGSDGQPDASATAPRAPSSPTASDADGGRQKVRDVAARPE